MRRGWAAISATLLAAVALSGCGPTPVALPEGVTVSVFQSRFDRGLHQIEIKVSNDTDAAITVTSATLDSTRFAEPAVWDRPQRVPSGAARDLRVQLGEPACSDEPARDEVQLEFALDDGSSGTARLPIADTTPIDSVNDEDCLGVEVSAIATLAAGDTVQWTAGAHQPAVLDITATPTGADGTLTIVESKATVLLGLVDESGNAVYEHAEQIVVDAGSGPAVVRLRLVPARCDPHAVAEDKRGTFFPLEVQTSTGRSGQLYVPVSDAVRASLYDFFGDYCGLP
jgi:hypothetical protein